MPKSNKISREGRLINSSLQFISAEEIIPIHLFRYNQLINQLINVKEIKESEVDGSDITWDHFWEARNNKIRAYLDCIQTLIQKEELLQFHRKELKVEWNIEENILINQTEQYDFEKLSLDESVELLELIKLTKINEIVPVGVIQTNTASLAPNATESLIAQEKPNIELIKHETVTKVFETSINKNPTTRLQETLKRIAAEKMKEAGANLDDGEKQLINSK